MSIKSIDAVTLGTHDMAASFAFYTSLGFEAAYGGPNAPFTSYRLGDGHLNVVVAAEDAQWGWWGRVILYVDDVDALYRRALEQELEPLAPPRDAEWGERYFHLRDPDGHELSFARPLRT